jgi:hypothetical protein
MILQALVISVDMHEIMQQIVPLNFQCMNDSQELQVVGGVVLFMASKLSRSISNGMAILHQYSSNTHAGCITIHMKRLLDVGLSQHRCSSEELLQSEKGLFALRAPFEFGFLL